MQFPRFKCFALKEISNLKKIEHDFYICVPKQFDWFRTAEIDTILRGVLNNTKE